jgi:hypothetical protein
VLALNVCKAVLHRGEPTTSEYQRVPVALVEAANSKSVPTAAGEYQRLKSLIIASHKKRVAEDSNLVERTLPLFIRTLEAVSGRPAIAFA